MRDKRVYSRSGPVYGWGYDIRHQNPYFSFQFSSNLRILKDLAVVDVIASDSQRRLDYLNQINKILLRFDQFWENYHNHYPKVSETFDDGYLLTIKFGKLFYANILEPNKTDVIVSWEFVEDLCDSVREREESLAAFVKEISSLRPVGTIESESVKSEDNTEMINDLIKIKKGPVFVESVADEFFKILKEYFSIEQQPELHLLLKDGNLPKNSLLFNGNGNQLADAFKQLIEANRIVSCSKAELEAWIIDNFQYVSGSRIKPFTSGYLNSIISSDVKICKSPILKISKDTMKLSAVSWNKRGKNP
ncbi:MAG TPA: hypothetical protein VGN64_05800 [Dyadobacter sp.]|nr:hypothetical protein [Dyadobacter sp.]